MIGDTDDGIKAVKDIRRLKPDLVILDIRMPGQNGIEVLKAIKEEDNAPVVIMFTSYPYPQYRKRCMELGADYFFKKATEFEKVTEVIEHLIQEARER